MDVRSLARYIDELQKGGAKHEEIFTLTGYESLRDLVRFLRQEFNIYEIRKILKGPAVSTIWRWTRDIGDRIKEERAEYEKNHLPGLACKLRSEQKLSIADIAKKLHVGKDKIVSWLENEPDFHDTAIFALQDKIKENPDLSIEELKLLLPEHAHHTNEFIRKHIAPVRRRSENGEYTDPKSQEKYYGIEKLAKIFGFTWDGIEVLVKRKNIQPIRVLFQGRLRPFFPLQELLKDKQYRRRYMIQQRAKESGNRDLISQKPNDLCLRDWVVLLTILIYKNTHDMWPPVYITYEVIKRSYEYTLGSIGYAVSSLLKKKYLIARHALRRLKDHSGITYYRSFWATLKCPNELLIYEEDASVDQKNVIYRDYVFLPSNITRSRRVRRTDKSTAEKNKVQVSDEVRQVLNDILPL